MIEWIKEKYGVEYSKQGMSDLLKRLKVKKKVGRPIHPKKDEKQEERFKENFKEIAKGSKNIFFDEARVGLITDTGEVWTTRGIKPIIKAIFDRKYTYLYKAVNPITGGSF
ncbi:MAG: hypothetical protein DSY59_04325, partial [Persephonella sp.]